MIYTTNVIESFNSALRKVTDRKAAFPNEMSVMKILYLRVESVKDLFVMENSGSYHGLYHVLGGTIDFSRRVDPSSLRFNQLLIRLDNIKEVIIALNASVDGDLTGTYIKALLKEKDILISRIAYGIPVGSDLSYADQKTLSLALENRTKIK